MLDQHGTELRFDHISGARLGACAFMGYRMPVASVPQPKRMESWLLRPSGEVEDGLRPIDIELGIRGFVTGMWRAPSGTIYAVDFDGRVYVQRPDVGTPQWEVQDWGPMVELHGVWGLTDEHVFIWGRDATQPRMWELFEGRFVNMPAPPSRLTCLGGVRADCLYAAGPGGYLAHFNGVEWRRIPIRSMRPATALHVVDDNEMWLTTDMGKLFEGSRHGWGLRAQLQSPLCDVRRFGGQLFVAAKDRGLLRLDGRSNRLVPVDLMLPAIRLAGDADTLLALTEDALAVSTDGEYFETVARDALLQFRGAMDPLWEAVS